MKLFSVRTLVSLVFPALLSVAAAGATFTYQGRLTTAGTPASGTNSFEFNLYNVPVDGTALWTETQSSIQVSQGLFTVELGSVTPVPESLFTAADTYLGIRLNGAAEMTPRQKVTPAPMSIFSFRTAWAGVSGIPAGFADGVDNGTDFTAGSGLTLIGTQLSANFFGTGSLNSVSRSDHNHFGAEWTGSDPDVGFGIENTSTDSNVAISGETWGQSFSTAVSGNAYGGGSTGTNWGVHGRTYSANGAGVLGVAQLATASGVNAQGSGATGTALQITNGGIRVTGAGLGTQTAVFIHRATAANTTGNRTWIDHPQTNGLQGAILIVTPNFNPDATTVYNNHPIGVYYNNVPFTSGLSKWQIFNQDMGAMPANAAFNVLVVNP